MHIVFLLSYDFYHTEIVENDKTLLTFDVVKILIIDIRYTELVMTHYASNLEIKKVTSQP